MINRIKNFWHYNILNQWWWAMIGMYLVVILLIAALIGSVIVFVIGGTYIISHPELIGEYVGRIVNGFESTK